MAGILKTVFRFGVIAGIVAGGAALFAGPDRIHALFTQVRHDVHDAIDESIQDPVVLRQQLARLQKEYPKRIAQVRGDLAELQEQIRQFEREREIARGVVELATRDLTALQEEVRPTAGQTGRDLDARLQRARIGRAQARLARARQVAALYAGRAEDADRNLEHLYQQEERLQEVLSRLEAEQAQFQAQLLQLERQVDAVARNERLIVLMRRRQRTIDEMDRYEAASLDQVRARLEAVRARQEAELEALGQSQERTSYEEQARFELEVGEGAPGGTASGEAF